MVLIGARVTNMRKPANIVLLLLIAAAVIGSTWVGNTAHNSAWSAQVTLGTGDTTKTLKAAPGAGFGLVINDLNCTVVVAAAQLVDIEDTSGTVEVMKLGASATVNVPFNKSLSQGLPLTTNEALIIKPAAAGPSVHCVADGYITQR
jgi:hypothetical protein